VSNQIGPIKLDKIQFVSGLPKTRSGKIMRRILRKIAEGDYSNFGDTSTLLNPEIVEEIRTVKFNLVLIYRETASFMEQFYKSCL
jgi:acetyl-CoA synthetase